MKEFLVNAVALICGIGVGVTIALIDGLTLHKSTYVEPKLKKRGKLTYREWVDLLVFDRKSYYKLRDRFLSDPRNVGHCQNCPVYKPNDSMQRCEGSCWVSVHLSSTDDDDE